MELKDIISSGLLELFVTGLTSPEESVQVEQWITKHPEVKQEVLSIQHALETYATSHAIQPDPQLKNKILGLITKGNLVQPTAVIRKISYWFTVAAAASVILMICSIVIAFGYYQKYHDTTKQLQVAEQKLNQDSELNTAMHSDINIMTNRYAQPVVLNGTAHAPDALAKIFWMKNSGEVWVVPDNLPEVPSGKQYQLWAIVDGKPVDAGMISTSKGMYHLQKMKSFGKVDAFAITLEKTGGSPTPSMNQMVVISKI